ncbi:peptide ABC transporter substrate-binding protein [Tissierella pigra]|uniref:peptide ABC transporter substrate-binding protein n=1 Tax=Tissierella pigra TaxID=2607614 RepID=UPI001C1264B8|nr:peptide ABC transporter substrate-binding protein [Tissierella pigra]MBU5427243.1 peptide ABC transporter substrate-binding protein [Tissierella pigra]
MKYKKNLSLFLVILMVTMTIGCSEDSMVLGNNKDMNLLEEGEGTSDYTPVPGGQAILPLTNFNTLNPLLTENSNYYFFSKLIFEGLFEFDNNLNITNQLAESYNIKDNGRIVEIQLRKDVLWHDGQKFSAEDVAFTIDTIKYASLDSTYKQMFSNSLGVYGQGDIKNILNVNITGTNSLNITFDKSLGNNLEVLTFPIIPKHIFNSAGNSRYIKALEVNNYKPIGTGPFKFDSYEKMKEIKLIANDDYWNDRPYIDEILGMVFESEEDILTAFETGQISMATTVDVDWDKYAQNNRINILEFVSSNYEFLGFNFGKELFSGEKGEGLRRAIAYAIDRQAIIQKVYLGHGTQVDVPIHPDSWLLSDNANKFGYNIDLAKAELSKIGFKDMDNDGIIEDESGNKIFLKILTNSYNITRLKTAEMIKDDLRKVGILVSIYPENNKSNSITRDDIDKQWELVNNHLASGDYDIALLGWQLSVIPDLSFAFHSSRISQNTNFIRYSRENMDNLLQKTSTAGTREEKLKSYSELQELITKDLPYVSLFFRNKALLIDSKIIGDLNPRLFNPYKGIEKAYIPEEFQ